MNRLKELRIARGMTLAQLAKASGFGVSTINNFENGRTAASEEFLKKLGAIFDVAPHLLTGQAMNRPADKADHWRPVPVVSWAQAGAAHDYQDLCNQLEDWVESDCRDTNAFALIIEGDSMEPEFHAGDQVVFAPNSEPRNGDFVVGRLREGGGVVFKQFRRTGSEGQTIRLESLNPAYRPVDYPASALLFIYPAVDLKRRLRR